MLEQMNLQRKLDLLAEAPLTPERMAKVDRLITQLQNMKTLDYGPEGEAGKSAFISFLDHASFKIHLAGGYGKSQETLDSIAKRDQDKKITRQNLVKNTKKNRGIIAQFAEQYPRLINVKKDDFELVQPNGKLIRFNYSHDTTQFVSLIYAFRELYRQGAFKTAIKNVEEIRDFGFNISSKILSTEFSSFRTRYAMISEVVLSYEGPYVEFVGGTFKIVNQFIPGHCTLSMVSGTSGRKEIIVRNTSLGHIGEIVDTIDILLRVIFNMGHINQVNCMGDDVVEYEVNSTNSYLRVSNENIIIPSSEITSIENTAKYFYEQNQLRAKQRKE